MRFRWQLLIALFLLVIGVIGMISYDFYLRPYVLAKKMVVAKTDIPVNQVISASDLTYKSVPNELVPRDAIYDVDSVIGKVAIVAISQGTQLTRHMVDLDDLYPTAGEVIFPVPKEAIYAVNGSLRKRDLVDIVLIKEPEISSSAETPPALTSTVIDPAIEKVPVVYARSEDNQTVFDTEKGDTNQRDTATGRISTVELLLTKAQRDYLVEKVSEGYKMWLTRVGS